MTNHEKQITRISRYCEADLLRGKLITFLKERASTKHEIETLEKVEKGFNKRLSQIVADIERKYIRMYIDPIS